jgi:hypothetical protein
MEGRILGANEVAVSTTYFENAECLVQLDQRRETKYYNERQDKHNGRTALTIADIQTKEAQARFAKRRKALVEAAALKKKKDAEEGGLNGTDAVMG